MSDKLVFKNVSFHGLDKPVDVVLYNSDSRIGLSSEFDSGKEEDEFKDLTKEEIIDILISSHWSNSKKAKSLVRVNNETSKYLFGKNIKNEGIYLAWNGESVVDLTREIYKSIIREGNDLNLSPKYHIYATSMLYYSEDISFYKTSNKLSRRRL